MILLPIIQDYYSISSYSISVYSDHESLDAQLLTSREFTGCIRDHDSRGENLQAVLEAMTTWMHNS